MKRVFALLLVGLLILLVGCSKDAQQTTAVSTSATAVAEIGDRYTLVGIQLTDGGYMNQEALQQQSGGERLYVQLFEDGTAKMKIQPGEAMDMCYDETGIWRVDTPDARASYQIEDAKLTILDYPFVYFFEREGK